MSKRKEFALAVAALVNEFRDANPTDKILLSTCYDALNGIARGSSMKYMCASYDKEIASVCEESRDKCCNLLSQIAVKEFSESHPPSDA